MTTAEISAMTRQQEEPKRFSRPTTVAVSRSVGWVTFLEIIRDKILYNIILCSFLLLGIGFLGSRLSGIRQGRIILDFGLTAVSISCAMIAMFTGAALIGREYDRRTIFVALSRPISRFQFILGKYAGLCGVLFLNWLLLVISYFLILWQTAGSEVTDLISATWFWAVGLVFVQSMTLAAIAVFFSSFTTTSLSVIFTLGLYLVGNNVSQLRLLAAKAETEMGAALFKLSAALIPNLEHFNLGTKVSYGLPVSTSFALGSVGYGILLISASLIAAGIFLNKREA